MRLRTRASVWALLLLAANGLARQEWFRFAWFTDLHVGAGTGAEDLTAVVRDVNRRGHCRFVVVSGDITEMGSTASLRHAKQILDSLLVPYFIIPGNHDTKWSESGCTAFGLLWGSEHFSFAYGPYQFIGLHQGPIMRMGDGHVSPETRRWLDSVLVRLPEGRPLIVVTHYPLDASVDNWFELLDRLKRHNTQVVLCGHGHRNRSLDFEGIPGVMSRATLRNQAAAGYTIVTVAPDSMYFAEAVVGREKLRRWHAISLAGRRRNDGGGRYPRPDLSNVAFPEVRLAWTWDASRTIAAAPAVAQELVVVGDGSGRINCLDLSTGSLRWQYQTKGPVWGCAGLSGGKVVCGSADSLIYCLGLEDGQLRWQVHVGAPVVAAVQVEDGTAYVGDGHGAMHAIDVASGELRWTHRGAQGFVETRPLVCEGKVIFGAWDGSLYAVDAENGLELWRWRGEREGRLYAPAACWPVGAATKVFIVAPDRHMTALETTSGRVLWRTGRHQVREAIGISEDGDRVYVRCMTDTLVAIASASQAPVEVWASPCGYGYDIDPSMPVEKEGLVFFGTKNGYVYAVDAETGQLRWRYRLGVALVNTVAALGGRRLVATDADGRVALLTW
ncbi:MAG: outer membrane protein assembly factor BamB family protein [Candidatus Oleimicrobiaceae bacterium]